MLTARLEASLTAHAPAPLHSLHQMISRYYVKAGMGPIGRCQTGCLAPARSRGYGGRGPREILDEAMERHPDRAAEYAGLFISFMLAWRVNLPAVRRTVVGAGAGGDL